MAGSTSREKSRALARVARPFREAPAPRGDWLLGNTLQGLRDPIALFMNAVRDLGDIVRIRFGPFTYALVNDPVDIHHVLVENQRNYVKSRNYDGLKIALGTGLLTNEGDPWKRRRRLAQPAFHLARLKQLADVMTGATAGMLDRWERDPSIDLVTEMTRLTFRIVGLTLLGTDVEGDAVAIGRALDVGIRWANDYAEQLLRIPPWFPTPTNLRFRKAMRVLDRFVYGQIAARRGSGKAGDDLLGMLIDATDGDDRMTDKELRDDLLTLVVAGHETTANALVWALSLLDRHPDVVAKLRAEIATLGERPRFEDLPRLAYTDRVVQEALRLYPPAWCFEREALAEDVVGGYVVPRGTTVMIAPYVLQRSDRYWTTPDTFDPDRFLPDRLEARSKAAYLPFGDGPRVCIGNAFAMMELKLVLAMIVRRFDVVLEAKGDLPLAPGITLRPNGAVRAEATVHRENMAPARSSASTP